MRSLGKVHSLRVSGRYLLVFSLFILFFVVISIIVINRYLDLLVENETLRENNVRLSSLVKNYRLKSQLASQYQLLIAELNQAESANSLAAEQKSSAGLAASKPNTQAKDALKPTANLDKKSLSVDTKQPPVNVSDLVLKADELKRNIQFSFYLHKINEQIELVSGYTIVVLENQRVSPPARITFPSSIKMVNGVPSNFRRGQQFAIRRGKIVKGVIDGVSDPKAFTFATIYAYSFKGELLLKKTITVADGDKAS